MNTPCCFRGETRQKLGAFSRCHSLVPSNTGNRAPILPWNAPDRPRRVPGAAPAGQRLPSLAPGVVQGRPGLQRRAVRVASRTLCAPVPLAAAGAPYDPPAAAPGGAWFSPSATRCGWTS